MQQQSRKVFVLRSARLTVSPPSTTAGFLPEVFALGGFMVATRSGDFQLGLMLATALAVLVLPTAAEAYTPEGRQACTGDAFRLCSAEIPSVDRVRACLHRNKAQLSPGCRGFISPGAHRPTPGDR